MTLNPDTSHFEFRYRDLEPFEPEVLGRSKEKIEDLKSEFKSLKKFVKELNSDNKEIRYYNTIPIFWLEIFDEIMFVGFYGFMSRGLYSPILMLEKRKNSEIYNYFLGQFDRYWCDNAYDWISEGNRLFESDSFKAAYLAFEKAIRIDPSNAIAWNSKIETLKRLDKNKEAEDALTEARKCGYIS